MPDYAAILKTFIANGALNQSLDQLVASYDINQSGGLDNTEFGNLLKNSTAWAPRQLLDDRDIKLTFNHIRHYDGKGYNRETREYTPHDKEITISTFLSCVKKEYGLEIDPSKPIKEQIDANNDRLGKLISDIA